MGFMHFQLSILHPSGRRVGSGDFGLLMIPLAALNVVIPHFRAVTLSWDWA